MVTVSHGVVISVSHVVCCVKLVLFDCFHALPIIFYMLCRNNLLY